MKLAILVSGCVRQSAWTGKLYYERFFKNFDCDVFIHTWNINGKRRGQKVNKFEPKLNNKIYNEIRTYFKPRLLQIDDMIEIVDKNMPKMKILTRKRTYESFWCQVYGLYKVNQLKEQYQNKHNIKYDYVVRMRFDKEDEFVKKINELTVDKFNLHKDNLNKLRLHDRFFILPNNTDFFNKIMDIVQNKEKFMNYQIKGHAAVDNMIICIYIHTLNSFYKKN